MIMAILDFFLSSKKTTANLAKERLQIIVAERRRGDVQPDYLPQLKRELLDVVCKYVKISPDMLTVELEQKGDDITVLEMNITLPDGE